MFVFVLMGVKESIPVDCPQPEIRAMTTNNRNLKAFRVKCLFIIVPEFRLPILVHLPARGSAG